MFVLYFIVGNKTAIFKILFISAVFSTSLEILQRFNVMPGTFDIIDILVEILAEIMAVIIIKKQFQEDAGI